MMDKKELLNDGMLERYLLGDLGAADAAMVQEALAGDPDLAREYSALERDLEVLARQNGIQPPPVVKDRILREIAISPDDKVRPLKSAYSGSTLLVMAAALALLFLLSSVWLYQRLDGLRTELELVRANNQKLEEARQETEAVLAERSRQMATIRDAATEKYVMRGNQNMPEALAVGYLNHQQQKVLLDASGLPKLPEGKDYQLWGDVEGEMIDMGVLPKKSDLVEMRYLPKAESLNITIEPEGGSEHPTVEQLITNVYLKQTGAP